MNAEEPRVYSPYGAVSRSNFHWPRSDVFYEIRILPGNRGRQARRVPLIENAAQFVLERSLSYVLRRFELAGP
jgi:hypothetical protein